MRISELFYSIQGEGELVGIPSFFIRLHGCNLNCLWCDTPYASRGNDYADMTVDQILEALARHPAARYVVITGGEPLLADELPDLTRRLHQAGHHITIETNGTRPPPPALCCHLASISPKLAHSQTIPPPRPLVPAGVLNQWAALCPVQLKFVVQRPDDLLEITAILHTMNRPLPPEKVLLMPETTHVTDSEWMIEICKEKGYRYCHRLQYTLFGNRKGT